MEAPGAPQPRRRRSAEERTAQILRAAVTLFAARGFERTTTKDIAREAGISEGTIYKYFASKQELLLAMITPVVVGPLPRLFAPEAPDDDARVIGGFIENRFALWEKHRDLIRVIMSEAIFNPSLAEVLRRMALPAADIVERYLARRVADGAFRGVNPAVVTRALVGQLLGIFYLWNILPVEDWSRARPDIIRELTQLFLHGTLAPPEAS